MNRNTQYDPLRKAARGIVRRAGCGLILGLALLAASPAPASASMQLLQIGPPQEGELSLLPKNLLRWHMGARLLIPRQDGSFQPVQFHEQATVPAGKLLQDDISEGVHLEPGTHDFVIDLGEFAQVSRFFSLIFTASGSISLRGAEVLQPLAGGRWIPLGRVVPFQPRDMVDLRFPLAEVRYLWVNLQIRGAGEIGTIGAMGMLNLAHVQFVGQPHFTTLSTVPGQQQRPLSGEQRDPPGPDRPPDETSPRSESLPFNFASLAAGARVSFVSAGDPRLVNYLIDDDPLTYYEIPPDHADALIVLDLGTAVPVSGLTLNLESGPGAFEVYTTLQMPFGVDPFPDDEHATRIWSEPSSGLPLYFASTAPIDARGISLAQTARFRPIYTPSGFLEKLGPPVQRRIQFGEDRVALPVSPARVVRYVFIRWIPDGDLPIGVRVFDLGLIGPVEPAERLVDFQVEPLATTEFAALQAAQDSVFDNPATGPSPPPSTINPGDFLIPDDPVVSH